MNNKNLIPIRSKSEAREKGRLGGIASGKARREKKTLKAYLEQLLELPMQEGGGINNAEAIATSLIKQALAGNTKAFEIIRDTIGENPKEKQEQEMPTPIINIIPVSPDETKNN